jgi:hypothetical protein
VHEQIGKAIKAYDRLLLILSENSMRSEWVKTEVENARLREIKEKRQILFPIGLVPFRRIKMWEFFDVDAGRDAASDV